MRRVLASDQGGELYAKRQGMIEPVFAHTKFNRRMDRFQRRGRAACRSEWRLMTATHNLLRAFPRERRQSSPPPRKRSHRRLCATANARSDTLAGPSPGRE